MTFEECLTGTVDPVHSIILVISETVVDAKQAVDALGALAHENRLAIYRMLIEQGPDGLAAGVIARRLGVPPSSLTFHLQHLLRAELVTQRRVSRQLIYATDFTAMNGLVAYLTENCCGQGGAGAVCDPAASGAATAACTATAA